MPWLYLKGISTGEMSEALKVLVGNDATSLSANTISRLKMEWGQEYQQWQHKELDKDQWVYIWADGIYSGLRSEDTKLCALVIIGVNQRGQKHFLAIGDGALGFWKALDEVYSTTRHQRYWVQKRPAFCGQPYFDDIFYLKSSVA